MQTFGPDAVNFCVPCADNGSMARLLRPLTLYVLATVLYLVAVESSGLASAAAAVAGHLLAVSALVLVIHGHRHPTRNRLLGPPFTRTGVWRAFKLFYCIAVPPLVYLAVKGYQDAQYNPYEYLDASGDVAAQLKAARETLGVILKETTPVVQSMWLGLPLVAVGLFYAVRSCVAYVIGSSEQPSVGSRAA